MIRSIYKPVLLLVALTCASAAQAREPLKPLNLKARYLIAWSGITLGRIYLTAEETPTHYRMVIDTKTRGIGALISDEKRIVEAEGIKNAEGQYLPARYNARPQKDPEEDVVTITYDVQGQLVERTRRFPDDPSWRPVVPEAEVNTATDPVTAAFILRRGLYDALENGGKRAEASQRTYDGLRLATMRLTRSGQARVAILERYRTTIRAHVTRTPISGYTPKEIKKFNKGDPQMHIFFTDDAAFLPVRASAKTPIGELSMTLVERVD
jgi:hypothetical protein